MVWGRADHKRLSETTAEIDLETVPASETNLMLTHTFPTGGNGAEVEIKTNNSSGNDYTRRYNLNNGTDGTQTGMPELILTTGDATTDCFKVTYIINDSGNEKLFFTKSVSLGGSSPNYDITCGVDTKTAEMTDINVVNTYYTGDFASASNISILGDNTPSSTVTSAPADEKESLTNVPAGTRYEETDTRKIYRMTEKATSSQSTGSTGGWEYVMNTGQTNWSVDFMGQKFEADHELIGATIDSISFDLSKNGSVADVLKLAKANSSNTITVLESIPISSVSSSGSGSGNTANFTTMTFDSFTPFVLQANDKLGIYASGTMGGNSSDSNCSGACTYVEIAHTSSNASANETRYGIANDGSYFTTGNHNDDIKYSIGVSPSMKIWKERGTAV